MADGYHARILTINSGSSSIKFALYRMGEGEQLVLSGSVGGIGSGSGIFRAGSADGAAVDKKLGMRDHGAAVENIIAWLRDNTAAEGIDAVGHRLVHGGGRFNRPHLITPDLAAALDELIPLAPDHLPHEIHAVTAFRRSYPGVQQVACFDTAFHRTMPAVAQMYALPEDARRHGVIRYGFHGLSYEYILSELGKEAGQETACGRVIIAHLGNGASMVAVKGGRSLDTTMGFTPAGGLVMSTRSGDLDPGVIVYLLKEKRMDVAALNRMINKQSGLIGVSGTSSDMKELLSAEEKDPHAAEAIELFCYQARKFLGALAAVLGGLDTLIFTGGIGEHEPPIRERICRNAEFLGIRLDARRNGANNPVISADDAAVFVRVMKTNEELMIARHTYGLIKNAGGSHEQK